MSSAHKEFALQTRAVIYCRVSSAKQTTRGDGLGSQETRCREYARYKGLEVAEIFHDDMTGSLATRPGMKAMLAYLRKLLVQKQFGQEASLLPLLQPRLRELPQVDSP